MTPLRHVSEQDKLAWDLHQVLQDVDNLFVAAFMGTTDSDRKDTMIAHSEVGQST